jgi:multimeric flavodoxin WrbA
MQPKRIVALIGSPRKKETWTIVQQFEKLLRSKMEIDFEYVHLKACDLQQCRGCFLCLTKGEEYCPLKDDRELLVNKLLAADGVIFATPNYSLQVTAIMKNFLDRIAYTFHRPCFFHKPCMAIVTQGAIGANKILKYFADVATFTGFINIPGLALTTVSPRTAADQALIDRKTGQAAHRFARALGGELSPHPSIVQVLAFRMVRAMYRATPDDSLKDVRYYRDNGWFTAPYFYPVRLGAIRTILGGLVEKYGASFARKRKAALLKASFGSASNE